MVLSVSRSSYYAWEKRTESMRSKANSLLLKEISYIHRKSNKIYGSSKIARILNSKSKCAINHKRVEHIMSKNVIKSKVSKKFIVTTNSNHKLSVTGNILNRDFDVDKPNEKMVSDIAYLWTDEGSHTSIPLILFYIFLKAHLYIEKNTI